MRTLAGTMAAIISLVTASAQTNRTMPEFGKYFEEYKVKGSFVLYDLKADSYTFFNQEQFNQEFTSASTFKIYER